MEEQKNCLQAKDLALEIGLALKDVFVATIKQKDEEITMTFPGGEKFVLKISKAS